ncbi:zinc-ribbon domain containing protein [Pelotomaculum propionicicum]|uniref:zinc-ribbon domain containing protein n=1 Tax=Pelotomaculum propionicicum TaxID=258475 RepID=UPI003B7B8668
MDDTIRGRQQKIRFCQAAQNFTNKAKNLASVQEVVLCGSMASDDPYPLDIDLAVVLDGLHELSQLARFCRQISSVTHAWEVFVFNTGREYLGRICHKRECPGLRYCDAPDCGKIPHLHNVRGFRFKPALFLSPQLQILWSRNEESILLSWRRELNLRKSQVKSYEAIRLICRECGNRFIFEASEQKFFAKRGWQEPKRCESCREKKWLRNMGIDPEWPEEDEDEE